MKRQKQGKNAIFLPRPRGGVKPNARKFVAGLLVEKKNGKRRGKDHIPKGALDNQHGCAIVSPLVVMPDWP